MELANIVEEYHYQTKNVVDYFSEDLQDIIDENSVIVCIGTDRNIGDSVGPMVGTLLTENDCPIPVYGTLDSPIHALNLERRIEEIKEKHPNALILAIDASLGSEENLHNIVLKHSPIRPGRGAGKDLPSVGDYSMIAIVEDAEEGLFKIKGLRLSMILQMSRVIANSIMVSLNDNAKADKLSLEVNK